MWNGDSSVINPYAFKAALSRIAPQFLGFVQQDAHEFITCLLNGLHEELADKKGSLSGESVEELAVSPIFELCGGITKSSVTCPACSHCGSTFTLFSSIQVPLPLATNQTLSVTFVPFDRRESPSIFSIPCTNVTEYVAEKIGRGVDLVFVFKPMGGEYRVSEPVASCLGVNFAFEIPDAEQRYAIMSINATVASNTRLSVTEISTPMLVPMTDFVEKKCEERMEVFWTASDDDVPPHAASLEARLRPFDSGDNSKFCVEIPESFEETQTPILLPPIKIQLNCNAMKEKFNWATLLNVREEETKASQPPARSISLIDCHQDRGITTVLDEKNKWKCHKCGEYVLAEKCDVICKCGPILILQLERFLQVGGIRRKYDVDVEYPDVLDLGDGGDAYEFVGCVEHYGSLNGGHYTAHCFHAGREKWYGFNDSFVKESSLAESHSGKAYILFYRRL
jgi:ubiquitin C-terminal hydrolase